MSIRKMYDAKKIEAKRNGAAWLVDFKELYMEPGYNIRDGEINPDLVKAFCDSFMRGEYVPAIGVDVTEKGLRVNDGQHRYLAAQMAISLGKDKVQLECVDLTGLTEAQKVARMLKANDGTPTSNLARANAYARMEAEGLNAVQIAEEVSRSVSDVRNMLALARIPAGLKERIKAGSISYVSALRLHTDHGDDAEAEAERLQQAADDAGTKKITPKVMAPKKPAKASFPASKAMRLSEVASLIELVQGQETRASTGLDDEVLTLVCTVNVYREFAALVTEYLEITQNDA